MKALRVVALIVLALIGTTVVLLTRGDQSGVLADGIWPSEDLEPGLYIRSGSGAGCVWARLREPSWEPQSIIANAETDDQMIVELVASDPFFGSRNCGGWKSVGEPRSGVALGDGTYLVGREWPPGRYGTRGSPECSWTRLRNFRWEPSSIIEMGSETSPAIVEVDSGDEGFHSVGCSPWSAEP